MWTLNHYYKKFTESILSIFVLLAMRWQLFDVFYTSGRQSLDNWDVTLSAFQDGVQPPLISPDIAAYISTGSQLICSILLLVGLMTRWAALPLLILTLILQIFITQNPDHYFWMTLAGALMCFGPGKLSLDYGICCWVRWRNNKAYK